MPPLQLSARANLSASLPSTLLQLVHRQSADESETTPFQMDGADDSSSENPHHANPLTIGLVAGLLSAVMIVALGFMFRQHMRKQRRRAAEEESQQQRRRATRPSPAPSMRDKGDRASVRRPDDGKHRSHDRHTRNKPSTSSTSSTYRPHPTSRSSPSAAPPSPARQSQPKTDHPARPSLPSSSSDDADCPPDLVHPRSGSLSSASSSSSSSSGASAASTSPSQAEETVVVSSFEYGAPPPMDSEADGSK